MTSRQAVARCYRALHRARFIRSVYGPKHPVVRALAQEARRYWRIHRNLRKESSK